MDEERVRNRILDQTRDRIFEEGFAHFTMDDVARDSGVSKKTLYRLIPSKNDLVLMVVGRQVDAVERRQKAILEDPELSFEEKVDGIVRTVSKILVRIGRKTVRDMAKVSPDLWEEIRLRRLSMIKHMVGLLEEGRNAGNVRTDLPTDFIAAYFVRMIDAMVTPGTALEADMTVKELLDSVLKMFFDGVLVERAKEARG